MNPPRLQEGNRAAEGLQTWERRGGEAWRGGGISLRPLLDWKHGRPSGPRMRHGRMTNSSRSPRFTEMASLV